MQHYLFSLIFSVHSPLLTTGDLACDWCGAGREGRGQLLSEARNCSGLMAETLSSSLSSATSWLCGRGSSLGLPEPAWVKQFCPLTFQATMRGWCENYLKAKQENRSEVELEIIITITFIVLTEWPCNPTIIPIWKVTKAPGVRYLPEGTQLKTSRAGFKPWQSSSRFVLLPAIPVFLLGPSAFFLRC